MTTEDDDPYPSPEDLAKLEVFRTFVDDVEPLIDIESTYRATRPYGELVVRVTKVKREESAR